MFDISLALFNFSGKVNSIIIDLTDINNLSEGFPKGILQIINYINGLSANIHGFNIDSNEIFQRPLVFNRRQRVSNWRLILNPKKENYMASPLYLKVNREDMVEVAKNKKSNRFKGFFMEFKTVSDLKEFEEEYYSSVSLKNYENLCYIKNCYDKNLKSDMCKEIYVDTSYILNKGFYDN